MAADHVYEDFEGDRIKHMTKIWNDTISLQQLGWMQPCSTRRQGDPLAGGVRDG